MKKYKGVFILCGVVVLLVAAYLFLTLAPSETPANPEETVVTDIFETESETIKSLKISSENEIYTLVYDGENVSIEELPGAEVDKNKANETKSSLSYISTIEIIDETPDDIAEFGLSAPSYTLEVNDGTSVFTLLVGDQSPVGNGYYCKTSDSDRVFLLSNSKYSYISTPSSYYRTVSLFEVSRDTISNINIDVYGKHTLQFRENIVEDTETPHNVFNKYQMITPFNWPASGDMVGKILDSVNQFEIVEYASESSDNIAEFGFSPYVAKLSFSHDGGKEDTVYFGNSKEGVIYVRFEGDERIYGVTYEPFSYLELDPFSYLSNFAFLRNIMTVKHIEYKNEDVSAEFILSPVDTENVDVKKDGKLMSQEKFKELYTELISISVDGKHSGVISDKAFLTYTFDYTDGSSEKVEFFKIDERRAALFVNGKCQFYVNTVDLNEKLEKINEIIKNN